MDGDLSEKGARSYTGKITDGDTLSFRVNLRWMFNSAFLLLSIFGAAYSVKQKIDDTARRVAELEQRVADLKSIHDAEMKEIEAWYKKSLDINPLNIFGKPKRK